MKPKQQLDPNMAGAEVLRLLKEDGIANASLKDIRSAKVARKEQLKAALTVVWQAFEAGHSVNGYATRKEWCKNFAKVTPRHCEHIIYGRKPSGGRTSVRSIKVGDTLKIGNMKLKVAFTPEGIGLPTKKGYLRITYLAVPVEEEKPAPKKKVKMYSTKVPSGDFITMPAKPHRTHKMQPDGKRTFCGKTLGLTLAKDARMSDDPTCRGCRTGEDNAKLREEYKAVLHPAAQELEKTLSNGCPTEEAL